ncbi:MAG: lipopolysaccharide biosynthesis protein RfbH [Desulfobacteraceae bacterium]|nr:lipopolysaccharide biosynthesis protein RfbH [Desulfobacteraceae bacterium]
MKTKSEELRAKILQLVKEYYEAAFQPQGFVPGNGRVPVGGRVFDHRDLQSLVDASLDFWLTQGRFAAEFEREFSRFTGAKHSVLVNSGSSANLLALSALTSPSLGARALRPGDEIITVAAGFPTTVNPIVQNGLVPVFIDVTLPTYNVDVSLLDVALSDNTKGVMLAHTLGNPFDVRAVLEFVQKNRLWLIEDCCDGLGSLYDSRKVGTFGDLSTFSFYPAHHITMGEGGCVSTTARELKVLVESFRDWGRDCWCEPGCDNTCGKRFDWKLGQLPFGFDHKYTYSHVGYNLKLTDMQAAVGVSQLEKLPGFIEARRRNFDAILRGLSDLEEFFIMPEATPGSTPSWFGFPLTVREGAPFTRNALVRFLEDRKIATRLMFGGNISRQPAYRNVRYRVAGSLEKSDFVMNRTFWIGVYPGIAEPMLDYVLEVFHSVPKNLDALREGRQPSSGRSDTIQ